MVFYCEHCRRITIQRGLVAIPNWLFFGLCAGTAGFIGLLFQLVLELLLS